ncbi:MAG TPA: LON peptidase substrate-binding domain-containing protein [Acidimicrobiales bacterium]
MDPEPLAMFPLAAVVFPTTELPLHVFEHRYQVLTRDVLLSTKEFGICLISRGCEVGGGDERVSVGTRVRIELAAPLDDDRWLLVTRGVERIRVVEWLPDDPYPRALVEPMPVDPPDVAHEAVIKTLGCVKALRRMQSEFADGWTSPCVDLSLEDAHSSAPWMLCAMSPLSLADLQALLEVPDNETRLAMLRELCDDKRRDLEAVMRLDDAR